ncbi:RNA dependent RNA polymerase-domain-containing protein [Haematococcus lacustris]
MGGVMVGGVKLLGLPYELLAFSTNQLRSASAWFLAPFLSSSLGFVNAQIVRTNVGDFANFTNRAKLAARLGQAFSCTVPVLEYTVPKDCSHEAHASGNADSSLLPLAVQQQIDMRTKLERAPPRMMNTPHALDRVIMDYWGRVQYIITDGVGRMGMQVAADIMAGLGRKGERPLAVQVRYQGCKGMLVPWPANSQFCDGQRGMNEQLIQVRPSMDKFESQHTSVEVCQVASFIPGYLNRQIIMLLLALGKNTDGYDEIFMTRAEEMIADLDAMLVNRVAASDMLRSLSCLGDHLARVMQAALLAGLDTREPLLQRLLSHVRLHSLQMLRAKHRIKLHNSAFLFGVIDETGVLSENEVFVQVQRPGEEASVLESQWVLITKNPCLHPGDIRVLRGARCPQLMHLVNVVVFPMNVERPHANTIAGSDLDGDQYFCCWDTPVVPLDRWGNPVQCASAAYDSAPAQVTPGLMQDPVKHLTDLFKEFQVNNNLGIIANAWVALADGCGAEAELCLKLSVMHSMAVDYAKTGVPACLRDCALPSQYPHFMENPRKPSYTSRTVLGRVYEKACQEGQKVVPVLGKIPTEPDPRMLLTGQPGWEQELEWAVTLCKEYNIELIKLLNKYGCVVEEELLTGWVLDTIGTHKQKRMDLRQQLLLEVGVVRRRFLHVFHKLPVPGSSQARTWPSLTTTMVSYDILEDAAREAVTQGPGHNPTGGASTERTLSALAREEAAEQGQPVTEQAQSRRQRRRAAWLAASLPGGAQPVNRGQVVRASAWYCAAYDPQYHPAAAVAERQAASRLASSPPVYSEYKDEEDDEAATPTQGLPSTLAAANPTGFRLLSFGWLAMDVLLKGLVQAGELQVPAADSNPQPPATTSKAPRRPRPTQPAASMAQPVSVAQQLGGSTGALFGGGDEAQLARALQDVFARMSNWNIR